MRIEDAKQRPRIVTWVQQKTTTVLKMSPAHVRYSHSSRIISHHDVAAHSTARSLTGGTNYQLHIRMPWHPTPDSSHEFDRRRPSERFSNRWQHVICQHQATSEVRMVIATMILCV